MSKAKIASKAKAKSSFLLEGKKIIPVKFVSEERTFMSVMYSDTTELVKHKITNKLMTWAEAKALANFE